MLTGKKRAAIPLLTSAVIFEKVPTNRNTAAEKMTSSARYCSPSPFLSVPNSHASNPPTDVTHAAS
ncbi:hypothetical protein ABVT39_006996 [Epinephelus coioides]